MWEWANRHRKRLLASAAAGFAGVAAYQWWSTLEASKLGKRHHGDLSIEELVRTTTPSLDEVLPDLPDASDPRQQQQQDDEDGSGGAADEAPSMDESMLSHFSYIQEVSSSEELEQLLPRLQAVLAEATDVAQALRQPSMASATTADKLQALARLSFARALGACWIIALTDLFVRVKLNIIGRHLFLQEKLSKLKLPTTPAPSLADLLSGALTGAAAQQPMPPRLTAGAIETFLRCDFFAERGCKWLLARVVEGCESGLSGASMAGEVSPAQLIQLMGALLVESEQALGPGLNWADVLVGSDAAVMESVGILPVPGAGPDAYQRRLLSASMAEELHDELRAVIGGPRFNEAVRAGVQHAFKAAAGVIFAALPPAGAAPAAAAAAAPAAPKAAPVAEAPAVQVEATPAAVAAAEPAAPATSADGAAAAAQVVASGEEQPQGSQGAGNGSVSSIAAEPAAPAATPKAAVAAAAPAAPEPAAASSPAPAADSAASASAPKASLPLARLLKPVQGASDPLFASMKHITKGIATLAPVMALCADAFASAHRLAFGH